tara:strand:- start:682 stop:1011 length:330 start_codon:yes stop_codon:yes gene_type:complete
MKNFYSYNNGTARFEGFLPKNLSPALFEKKVNAIVGRNKIQSVAIFEATDWNKKSCHNIRLKTDDPAKILYMRLYGLTETKIKNLRNKFKAPQDFCICFLNPLFCNIHS